MSAAELKLLSRSFQREAPVLVLDAKALPSHLHNVLFLEEGSEGLARLLLERARGALTETLWLRLTNRPAMVAARAALQMVLGAGGSVASVAFSPDGTRIATAGFADSVVRLWDARSGEPLADLAGHEDSVMSVTWSPDGHFLASGGKDGTVRLWDARAGTPQAVLVGHNDMVGSVAWSAQGSVIASGSDDRSVRLWDVESARSIAVLGPGRTEGRTALAGEAQLQRLLQEARGEESVTHVDRGAALVVTGSYEEAERELRKAIEVDPFNAAAHGNMAVLRIRQERPREAIAWVERAMELNPSVDGGAQTLARAREMAGGADPVVDPAILQGRPGVGHSDYVRAVAWSPDGSVLASGGYDRTARLWDPASGSPGGVLTCGDHVFALAWSPDGGRLACGCNDGKVWLWQLSRQEVPTAPDAILEGHSAPVLGIGFSPDGSVLASGGADRTLALWTLPDHGAAPPRPSRRLRGHLKSISSVSWSPAGDRLASAGGDGAVRVWDAAGGPRAEAELSEEAHTENVWDVAWSPDGSLLASVGDDPLVRLWCPTGEQQCALSGHDGPIFSLGWSPDGAQLASGGHDRTVRIWAPATGEPIAVEKELANWVSALAWSPDGSRLAWGEKEGEIRIWEPGEGRKPSTLKAGDGEMVRALAWSAEAEALASADLGHLAVWAPAAAAARWSVELQIEKLPDHADLTQLHDLPEVRMPWINAVAFSPDGCVLATGGDDHTVRLWGEDGELLAVQEAHALAVQTVAWSPDGAMLATGGLDRAVRLWNPARLGNPAGTAPLAVAYCLAGISTLRFSPDGHVLLVADNGATTGNRPTPYVFEVSNLDA